MNELSATLTERLQSILDKGHQVTFFRMQDGQYAAVVASRTDPARAALATGETLHQALERAADQPLAPLPSIGREVDPKGAINDDRNTTN